MNMILNHSTLLVNLSFPVVLPWPGIFFMASLWYIARNTLFFIAGSFSAMNDT